MYGRHCSRSRRQVSSVLLTPHCTRLWNFNTVKMFAWEILLYYSSYYLLEQTIDEAEMSSLPCPEGRKVWSSEPFCHEVDGITCNMTKFTISGFFFEFEWSDHRNKPATAVPNRCLPGWQTESLQRLETLKAFLEASRFSRTRLEFPSESNIRIFDLKYYTVL